MTAFHDLLRVQEHDTAADQIRHRHRTLPERAELRASEESLARVEASLVEVGGLAAEATRTQRRIEVDLVAVQSKITDLDAKLYSGTVTAPRDLQAMQAEGAALQARRLATEDEVLDAMQTAEALDERVEALRRQQSDHDTEGVRFRVLIAEREAEVERELAAELAARADAAGAVAVDLMALYEQLRTRLGGVAAAPLTNGRCGGCHLALPATELARLRKEPPDSLVRCEQCERILVRP